MLLSERNRSNFLSTSDEHRKYISLPDPVHGLFIAALVKQATYLLATLKYNIKTVTIPRTQWHNKVNNYFGVSINKSFWELLSDHSWPRF